MRTLLQFLVKYSILLLFLVLEIVAFILLVRHNNYPQSAVLSSANRVSATLYEAGSTVSDYFSLRTQNRVLMDENAELRNRIAALENKLESVEEDSLAQYVYADKNIEVRAAKVINNSTHLQRNYMTLNKGERDGVGIDMGVVSKEGVVGIVSAVSEKYAVVIPVLNPKVSISCKLRKNGYVGTLHWDGKDYRFAELQDIARHIDVNEGDTIVTSGYSDVFPENLPVGIIDKAELTESDAYYNIKVRLAVNFKTIEYVSVIENKNREEQKLLEGVTQNK